MNEKKYSIIWTALLFLNILAFIIFLFPSIVLLGLGQVGCGQSHACQNAELANWIIAIAIGIIAPIISIYCNSNERYRCALIFAIMPISYFILYFIFSGIISSIFYI